MCTISPFLLVPPEVIFHSSAIGTCLGTTDRVVAISYSENEKTTPRSRPKRTVNDKRDTIRRIRLPRQTRGHRPQHPRGVRSFTTRPSFENKMVDCPHLLYTSSFRQFLKAENLLKAENFPRRSGSVLRRVPRFQVKVKHVLTCWLYSISHRPTQSP